MKEYTITKVSTEEPRTWDGPNGTTYYIKVMLEGHQKPVSIGKKQPNSLNVGDKVFGQITETQYPEDKFTAGKNPNYTGGYQKGGKQPMDTTTMYVSYAKDILVAMIEAKVELKDFDAYIVKVAESGKKLKELIETEPKKDWVKPGVREKLQPKEELPPVDTYDNINEDTEINLDDIPF